MVGAEGFELEPLCGRLSPQAKSRAKPRDLPTNGRGGGIRTPDPLLPKQMRYQTALRPDPSILAWETKGHLINRLCKDMALQLADKCSVLKGHGFSRAVSTRKFVGLQPLRDVLRVVPNFTNCAASRSESPPAPQTAPTKSPAPLQAVPAKTPSPYPCAEAAAANAASSAHNSAGSPSTR
jgi:hypothetical protein